MKNSNGKNNLINHNLTPSILIHPDGPTLLAAMLHMGISIDRLAADTRSVHRSRDEVIALVSNHVMGDVVIESGHDPPVI